MARDCCESRSSCLVAACDRGLPYVFVSHCNNDDGHINYTLLSLQENKAYLCTKGTKDNHQVK